MNYFSIDALIVYGYLLITLIVGLWAGRNVKTIQEYALANRMFGTGVLIIGFLATWVGGSSILGESKEVFEDGIIRIIASLAQIVSILFIAWAIAPKMHYFRGSMTLGDLMGRFYGKYARMVTGIASLGYTIGLVGMQIVSLGYVYQFLGLENRWGMFLGGGILIIYSAMGGIKSITITDIFQFIILIIVVPLIANAITVKAGGIQEVFTQIPTEKLVVFGHKRFSYYFMLFILAIFPVGLLSPPYIQLLLMANSKKQAANMYIGAAFFLPVSRALVLLIGLSAFIVYPHLHASQIIPTIINELLPTGLKGFCVAGLLAVIMSTADSFLWSGSLVVTHDLVKPFFDRYQWPINELKAARYITFLVGGLSALFAFFSGSIAELGFYAVTFLGPIVTIPLVAGIIGLQTDHKTFLIAFFITLISFLAANMALDQQTRYLIFPICLFINLISFFSAHYIQNKGFATVKRTAQVLD